MAQMRTSAPDESQLMILAFDLLHQDGVDLRALPLSDRKRDLRQRGAPITVWLSEKPRSAPRCNTVCAQSGYSFTYQPRRSMSQTAR